jgi:acetylornithine/succinyldiaminopimelate/putrescine aminotransferase
VVQAEAGVIAADAGWLKAVREKCNATGALLVFDEIQTGFGRTGTLWAFEKYGVVPDILLLGKALGGGLPLGAFVSSHEKMQALTHHPVLGHISTFAGHPVCCAAGLAGFEWLVEAMFLNHKATGSQGNTGEMPFNLPQKEQLFHTLLTHPAIKEIRSTGFLMAVQLENADICLKVCHECVKAGMVTDWFLFAPDCLRIAPPLIITEEQIHNACRVIVASIDKVLQENKM